MEESVYKKVGARRCLAHVHFYEAVQAFTISVPTPFISKNLQQKRMRNAAVNDVGLFTPPFNAVKQEATLGSIPLTITFFFMSDSASFLERVERSFPFYPVFP